MHQRQERRKGMKKGVKKWNKIRVEAQRAKPHTPTLAIDALIGEEEQTEKRRENKERNRERLSSPATLNPSVPSYDSQGLYGEPILFTSLAHG